MVLMMTKATKYAILGDFGMNIIMACLGVESQKNCSEIQS